MSIYGIGLMDTLSETKEKIIMKGTLINSDAQAHTYLRDIFDTINVDYHKYNWLISYPECYPAEDSFSDLFKKDYCIITGEDLFELVQKEDPQWIWGVLSAIPKRYSSAEIMKYALPTADGNETLWHNPITMQNPLAEIEIVAWDSSLTIVKSICDDIIDIITKKQPHAVDLEQYNSSNANRI